MWVERCVRGKVGKGNVDIVWKGRWVARGEEERRCVRRDAGGRGMKWRLEVGDGRKSSMLDE